MTDGFNNSPPIPSSSEVSLAVRIDRLCGEFEERRKAGESPTIEEYLAELPQEGQAQLFEELLGLELDYRARAGDSFTAEEYTQRFPQFAVMIPGMVVNVRRAKPGSSPTPAKTPTQPPGSSSSTRRSSSSGGLSRIGPYEILEPCGRGGMGLVYKAWHEFFKQYRAIKVLPNEFDEDDIHRFSTEIELAGRLNHPNIVRAHEANREQGMLYLVMEFVDGINLDHLVKHHKRLPLGLACELIRQAAEGLQHAHEHFLVHRDIKPSNLMLNLSGQVKILDFGLARFHAEQAASRLTKQGSLMGTVDFMAPEQWENPMAATIQADIYGLGCTLYYLITGKPPYKNQTHWLQKQDAHRNKPVPRLEGELAALQPTLERMMAKSKEDRFETPSELVEALEPFADPSELERYAKTPVPELALSAIQRTPIPTINVSSTDLVGSKDAGPPREEFSQNQSDQDSGTKTLRPHQSRTDLEAGGASPPPAPIPQPPWFKRRALQLGAAFSAVLLLGMLLLWPTPQNTELAVQMGALPGLNGEWWFEETPWYGPGIRRELMTAIRHGETEIAGVSLESLPARLADADTESLRADLRAIAQELASRLPDGERSSAGRTLTLNKDISGLKTFDDALQAILPAAYLSALDGNDDEALAEWTAPEHHGFAAIMHHLSESHSEFVSSTQKAYQQAIDEYQTEDAVEQVLLALARADYSRFLADQRDYSQSVYLAERAAEAVPEATLFQISLHCQLADQYRKWEGDSQRAKAELSGAEDSAEAWADHAGLANTHPLRAEILERRAWINVDGWHVLEAIDNFEQATGIRQSNRDAGNSFAWRPILFNQQGHAMALHFLGRDQSSPKGPGALAVYQELLQAIQNANTKSQGSRDERDDRLPNVYERMADSYFFSNPKVRDYVKAAQTLNQAILSAQGFENSATRWFHLNRLYYKRALALALSNDLDGAQQSVDRATKLEQDYAAKMGQDTETFQKQEAAFAMEKKITRSTLSLKDSEEAAKDDAWDDLRDLINSTDKNRVTRTNVEVLLLVMDQLFNSGELTATETHELAHRLLAFTEPMRQGDEEIRTAYLKPIIESAQAALGKANQSNPSAEFEETLQELKAVVTPKNQGERGASAP